MLVEITYDHCEMKNQLLDYLQSNKICFLRLNRTRCEEHFTNITNNIEDTNKWISQFFSNETCHKPKQPSFMSNNKYDNLLNYNNEQSVVDLRKNVRLVQEEQKQEASIVSDITTTIIKNGNNHSAYNKEIADKTIAN